MFEIKNQGASYDMSEKKRLVIQMFRDKNVFARPQ